MTTREQLRRAVGIDRSATGRGATADPGPSLPERLYEARERKGVDLYRAERDTKIRARYLGALERGDYKDLPGAVYTKGFLRNYALYLGLDPDEVLGQWRRERSDGKELPPAIVVPRAIAAPRKGLTFSPSLIVVRAAHGHRPGVRGLPRGPGPALHQATDRGRHAAGDGRDRGRRHDRRLHAARGRPCRVRPSRSPRPVASRTRSPPTSDGEWAARVDLRRGRNQFDVSSLDPETGKRSAETVRIFITVPFLVIEAPTLTSTSRSDEAIGRERGDPGHRSRDQRRDGHRQGRLRRPGRWPR